MHRIDTAGNVGGLFVPPNPLTGQVPVVVDSAWLNDVQENIVQVILAAGIALVKGNTTQLLNAIRQLSPSGYAVDTGAANAAVVTLSPAPAALTDGMSIRVKFSYANTGATTINVNALGAVAIDWDGAALAAGAVEPDSVAELVYDSTGPKWQLISLPQPADQLGNGFLTKMAAGTIKANITGSTAAPADVPISSLLGAMGFNYLAAANGFLQFPAALGGIMIQWGTSTVSAISGGYGNTAVAFAGGGFPNNCWGIVGSPTSNDSGSPTSTGNNYSDIFYGKTTAGFSMRLDNEQGASGSSISAFWVAIGD